MSKVIDLTGQRFGRLTVVERAENTKNGLSRWLCRCDCGNMLIVQGGNLKTGNSRSCGCLNRDLFISRITVHGMRDSRLYRIWAGILNRCFNPSAISYAYYGGRGITVSNEWKNSFVAFHDWAMANGYRDDLSIDRIDVSGDYEPANCRWVDIKTQSNNKRSNRNITFEGKTQNVTQWAEELNISASCLRSRLCNGWSVEKALTTPVAGKRKTK